MPDSDLVRVAVTGDVFVAPVGTTLPTSSSESLASGFEALGYLDENGITLSHARQIQNIRTWQNSAIARKITTEHDVTRQFTALETSATVLETYYGDYTDGADGVVEITGADLPRLSIVIDVYDGDITVREVMPVAQVTDQGNVIWASTDATKYPMTITAYPDDDGVKAYQYHHSVGAS